MNLIAKFLPAIQVFVRGAFAVLKPFLMARSNASQAIIFEWVNCWAAAAHFPDPFVRFLPMRLQELHDRDHERPVGLGHFDSPQHGPATPRQALRHRRRAEIGSKQRCRLAPDANFHILTATEFHIQ